MFNRLSAALSLLALGDIPATTYRKDNPGIGTKGKVKAMKGKRHKSLKMRANRRKGK